MKDQMKDVERVIGFDAHPDSFTSAALHGRTPAEAWTEKVFNKVPLGQLKSWARKHTTPKDLIVLEASGNSFHLVRPGGIRAPGVGAGKHALGQAQRSPRQ